MSNYLAFFILNLLVLTSATILTLHFSQFKINDWGKLVINIFIASLSQIFLTEIFLGIIGQLNFNNTLFLNAIITIGITALSHKKILQTKILAEAPKYRYLLTFLVILGPFIFLYLVRGFNGLLQFPYEYDANSYHLPLVVEWIKTHSIMSVYYSAFTGPAAYYPSNFELILNWVMQPFSNDLFANTINLVIFPFLIYGIYRVCLNLKIKPIIAMLAAAMFIYMPQTLQQLNTPQVDIFFTTSFVLSIFYLQEYCKNKNISDIIFFGLSSGFYLGTKYLGLPYLALPILILCSLIIFNNRKNFSRLSISIGTAIGSVLLTGSFWYIRNFLDNGNPIFPTEIKLFGKTIFEGYYGMTEKITKLSLLANIHTWESLKDFLKLFLQASGTSIFIFIPAIGLLVSTLIYSIYKKNCTKILTTMIGFMMLFGYGYLYWAAPYGFHSIVANVRYAMVLLVIACIASAYVFNQAKILRTIFSGLAVITFFINLKFFENESFPAQPDIEYRLIFQELKLFLIFITCFVIITGFFPIMAFINTKIKKHRLLKLFVTGSTMTIILLLTSQHLIAQTATLRIQLRPQIETALFNGEKPHPLVYMPLNANQWINQNAPTAKIAFSGITYQYPFLGENFQRNVSYININECTDCRYRDYKYSPDSIRRNPIYENWLTNLRTKKIDYIVISPDFIPSVKSWEYEWIQAHPNQFKQVYKSTDKNPIWPVYIYKIIDTFPTSNSI